MKKLFVITLCVFAVSCVFAQKQTSSSYQNTQARSAQVIVEPLVKPLIGEVEVIPTATHEWEKRLSKQKVEVELEGKLENVHNYGLYMFCKDTKADMIVAATFNLYSDPDDNGFYVLEIKGFPAVFKTWRPATPADYEWMKITGAYGVYSKSMEPYKKQN